QKLETEIANFQALQKEFQKVVQSRTQLESQLNENEMVSREFDLLKDDATIYKLIGPVLVKQDKVEAVTNVKKRIEFITAEIARLETQMADLESKQEAKKSEV
ncbi:Prefoldin, partial [Blyttiomyces helicus]